MLVPMIEALDERGPDSSGIAVYADRRAMPAWRSRSGRSRSPWAATRPSTGGRSVRPARPVAATGVGPPALRCRAGRRLPPRTRGSRPQARLLARDWPQVRVLGTGLNARVLKDTGRPTDTCARYGMGALGGLPGRRPHPHGHRVGGDRPALASLRARARSVRRAQRVLLQLRHGPAPSRPTASASTPTTTPR